MKTTPENWTHASLEELTTYTLGGEWGEDPEARTPGLVDVSVVRGTEFRTWNRQRATGAAHRKISEQSLSKRELQENDLVVEVSGGGPTQPVGRVLRIDSIALSSAAHPMVCSNFCRQLRLSPAIAAAYAEQYLQFRYASGDFIKFQKQTTNIRNLAFPRFLAETEVVLPPLPEQHRIVEAIESYFTRLDDAVETLERVQRNLKRYRASVLKAAVEGRLVPTEAELARAEGRDYEPASVLLERILTERRRRWEEAELAKMKAKGTVPKNDAWKAKYQEPAPPDTTGLPELPEGWCWATVDQLVQSLDQGWSPSCEKRRALTGEWSVMKTTAIQPLLFDANHNKALPAHLTPRPALELREGDVLVTRAGPRVRVGICALVRTTRPRLMLCDKAYRLRVPEPFIVPGYLELLLNSPRILHELEKRKSGISDSGLNLTQHRFLEMTVPLCPAPEQIRVVEAVDRQVSVADATAHVSRQQVARMVRLRQAILKWAFEGKLADQDPNDEPASVLLERIQRERAATPSTKTMRAAGRKAAKAREADLAETLNALLDDVHESPRTHASSRHGSAVLTSPRLDAPDDDAITVAIHAAAAGSGKPRDELIKDVSLALGYKRLGKNIRQELSNHIKTAVRRGVLENVDGLYRLARN